jgi:hypothetical protein
MGIFDGPPINIVAAVSNGDTFTLEGERRRQAAGQGG